MLQLAPPPAPVLKPVVPLTSRQAHLYAAHFISLGFPAIWLRNPAQTYMVTPKGPVDIPPERRGKAPVADGWNNGKALSIEELLRMWGEGEPGYNIGIRTGRVEGSLLNVVGVDLDSVEALAWAEEHLPHTEVKTRTSSGQHWLYRHPRNIRIGNRAHIGGMKFDFRGDGGQIVAPGSVHGTGFVYESVLKWTVERIADMPLFDPQWFGREAKWEGAVDSTVAEGGERRAPVHCAMERKRKRALAYLEHVPGTVPGSGQGAGAECLYYARALVYGLCIPPEEAARLMTESEWNRRCVTATGDAYPWTMEELLHKCQDAYRLAFDKPYGWMLLEDAETKPPATLQTHEILESIVKENEEAEAASAWWDFQVEEQEVLDPGKMDWPRTDTGNAERLVARFGESIRYVEDRRSWVVWDDKTGRWVDRRIGLERCSKVVARKIGEEFPACEESVAVAKTDWIQKKDGQKVDAEAAKEKLDKAEKNLEALRGWQRTSESSQRRNAMIAMAASEPNIAVGTTIFDQRHMLLNVRNGVLDLKTGQLRKHNRDYYFTKVCLVDYDEDAKCPTWERCVREWMQDDEEMVDFLQRIAGYILTGVTKEQVMFIFVGNGANGKSTYLNALRTVIGPYAVTASAGLLMETRQDKASPSQLAGLAALVGSRLVIATETDESGHLSEPQVKMVTGESTDKIAAKWMGENFFEFYPTHKTVLQTNYKPSITGTDEGIWRRLVLVDWSAFIDEAHRDKGLAARLMAERKGILAWAARGCAAWQERGLDPPESVRKASKEYRDEQDTFGSFAADYLEFGEKFFAPKAHTMEVYEQWCEQNAHTPFRAKRFVQELMKRAAQVGVKIDPKARTATSRGWGGLRLKS